MTSFLCLDSFFEVSQSKISFQTNKALCFASFLRSYPIFLQLCTGFLTSDSRDCSIFLSFLELQGNNAETSLHSADNANNSFHFPLAGKSATLQGEGTLQYQGKHGSLESNFSKSNQKGLHGLFVAISFDQSFEVTLVIYQKIHFLPSRRLCHKCLAMYSAYISVWATGWTFEASFQNLQHCLRRENEKLR